ncbi:hypothetical protein HK105_204057 [Polyrhizophydium stewartii]|uniref:Uncharacterized protein n=1 Tax=Polyrhizophydium stewartii TaxID=2732419 RepID=A0ABR4N9T5_9FUNG
MLVLLLECCLWVAAKRDFYAVLGVDRSASKGSLYCSSYCMQSAYAQCDVADDVLAHTLESLALGSPRFGPRRARAASAAAAAASLVPPSPLASPAHYYGGFSPAPTSPSVVAASQAYSLEFRNRPHHNHHHHHHSHHHHRGFRSPLSSTSKRNSIPSPPPFEL